jgi:hypothetical protein
MSSTKITLTKEQIDEVRDTAERQYLNAILGGNKNRHGLAKDQGKERDIQIAFDGLCGELAVCSLLELPWSPWLQKDGDIGKSIEVRTTKYPRGRLIWRPSTDKADGAYTLVRSHGFPEFEIVGWIEGHRIPSVGFYGDLCRMRGGKARENVWWVEGHLLNGDLLGLARHYYVPATEH